jgi:hypothetical protein
MLESRKRAKQQEAKAGVLAVSVWLERLGGCLSHGAQKQLRLFYFHYLEWGFPLDANQNDV